MNNLYLAIIAASLAFPIVEPHVTLNHCRNLQAELIERDEFTFGGRKNADQLDYLDRCQGRFSPDMRTSEAFNNYYD